MPDITQTDDRGRCATCHHWWERAADVDEDGVDEIGDCRVDSPPHTTACVCGWVPPKTAADYGCGRHFPRSLAVRRPIVLTPGPRPKDDDEPAGWGSVVLVLALGLAVGWMLAWWIFA